MENDKKIVYIAHCSPHEYVHRDTAHYLERFPDVELWSAADFCEELPPFPTTVSQVNLEMMSKFGDAYDRPFVVAMQEAERKGYGAAVTPSWGDPGIAAVQGKVSIPCVGMAWAGYNTATTLGGKFSVFHNHLPELIPMFIQQVEAYGFADNLVSIELFEIDVYRWLAIEQKPDYKQLVPVAMPLVERAAGKGAKVMLMACGSPELSEFATVLNEVTMKECGVRVLSTIDTAIQQARNLMGKSSAA